MTDKEDARYVNVRLEIGTWSDLRHAQRQLWTVLLCACEEQGRPACKRPSMSDTVLWLVHKAEAELGRLEVQGIRRKVKAMESKGVNHANPS